MNSLKRLTASLFILTLFPFQGVFASTEADMEGNYDASVEFEDDGYLVIGFSEEFDGMNLSVDDTSFSNNDYDLEFWDGSDWNNFEHDWKEEDVSRGRSYISFTWDDRPSEWEKDTMDGHSSAYMVRIDAEDTELISLKVKNLKVTFETETGDRINEQAERIEIDKDEDVVDSKYEGSGVYTYQMDAESDEDYEVTVQLDGYVQKKEEVSVGKSQKNLVLEFDYSYRIQVEDEDGDPISGADVEYDGKECEYISSGYYGCAVALDNDDEELTVSKSGYDTERTDLDRTRSSHSSAQLTQTVVLDRNGSHNNDDDDDDDDDDDRYDRYDRYEDESDLIVDSIRLDRNDDIEIRIRNMGEESTPNGEDITLYVYINNRLEKTLEISDELDEDEYETVFVRDEIGDIGTYEVLVEVDPNDDIEERNERNNTLTVTFREGNPSPYHYPGEDEPNLSCDERFIDIDHSFAESSIIALCQDGSVVGDDPRHFNPKDRVSRAEFVKMALIHAGYDVEPIYTQKFKDLSSNDWAYKYMSYAAEMGIIVGNGRGYIHPNDYISRGEAVVILAKLYEQTLWGFTSRDIPFRDVRVNDWFAYAVIIMNENGVVKGYGDGTFRPGRDITREESSVMIVGAEKAFN